MNPIRILLESRYPGLYSSIASTLTEAEATFNAGKGGAPSQFLLGHTLRVTAIARTICEMEGLDPFLPMLAALASGSSLPDLWRVIRDCPSLR